jgi:hypothetical protein
MTCIIHTYMQAAIHTCTDTYRYIDIHTYRYVHANARAYVHTGIWSCTHMHTCVHANSLARIEISQFYLRFACYFRVECDCAYILSLPACVLPCAHSLSRNQTSARSVNLDVTETFLTLDSPGVYLLEKKLPFPVLYAQASAKFRKETSVLEVVRPWLRVLCFMFLIIPYSTLPSRIRILFRSTFLLRSVAES